MKRILPGLAACGSSLGLAALALSPVPAFSQQQARQASQPGTLTTATIITGLEWNDNYNLDPNSPGDVILWDTVLAAGMVRRTTVDTFIADAEGTLRFSDEPIDGTNAQADNPIVSFSYDRTVDDSSLNFGARYQRADLDFFDPLSDIDPNGNFVNSYGGGYRESIRADVGLDLNTQGPVSLTFAATGYAVNYYETTNPQANDQVNNSALADVGFQLTPTLQMLVGGAYNFQTFSNATDTERRTTSADMGLVAQINQQTSSTLRVGYSEVIADRNTGNVTQQGVVGSFNILTQQINGQIGANFTTTIDENGERYNASVLKQYIWQNAQIYASLGATQSANTDVRPIGNIAYTYNMPRTTLGLSARQFATVDDNGDDTINSFLNASLSHSITQVSALSFVLSGGLVRYENSLQEDFNRVNFTAVYSHTLTPDWALDVGYRGRLRDNENTADAESNAVFIGLQRDFASIR